MHRNRHKGGERQGPVGDGGHWKTLLLALLLLLLCVAFEGPFQGLQEEVRKSINFPSLILATNGPGMPKSPEIGSTRVRVSFAVGSGGRPLPPRSVWPLLPAAVAQ